MRTCRFISTGRLLMGLTKGCVLCRKAVFKCSHAMIITSNLLGFQDSKPKVSADFEDLLSGQGFNAHKDKKGPKTIAEMRKEEMAKEMDPEKLKVSKTLGDVLSVIQCPQQIKNSKVTFLFPVRPHQQWLAQCHCLGCCPSTALQP